LTNIAQKKKQKKRGKMSQRFRGPRHANNARAEGGKRGMGVGANPRRGPADGRRSESASERGAGAADAAPTDGLGSRETGEILAAPGWGPFLPKSGFFFLVLVEHRLAAIGGPYGFRTKKNSREDIRRAPRRFLRGLPREIRAVLKKTLPTIGGGTGGGKPAGGGNGRGGQGQGGPNRTDSGSKNAACPKDSPPPRCRDLFRPNGRARACEQGGTHRKKNGS